MIIKHNIMLTTILWLWILEFGLLRKRKVASQKKKQNTTPCSLTNATERHYSTIPDVGGSTAHPRN